MELLQAISCLNFYLFSCHLSNVSDSSEYNNGNDNILISK